MNADRVLAAPKFVDLNSSPLSSDVVKYLCANVFEALGSDLEANQAAGKLSVIQLPLLSSPTVIGQSTDRDVEGNS